MFTVRSTVIHVSRTLVVLLARLRALRWRFQALRALLLDLVALLLLLEAGDGVAERDGHAVLQSETPEPVSIDTLLKQVL